MLLLFSSTPVGSDTPPFLFSTRSDATISTTSKTMSTFELDVMDNDHLRREEDRASLKKLGLNDEEIEKELDKRSAQRREVAENERIKIKQYNEESSLKKKG